MSINPVQEQAKSLLNALKIIQNAPMVHEVQIEEFSNELSLLGFAAEEVDQVAQAQINNILNESTKILTSLQQRVNQPQPNNSTEKKLEEFIIMVRSNNAMWNEISDAPDVALYYKDLIEEITPHVRSQKEQQLLADAKALAAEFDQLIQVSNLHVGLAQAYEQKPLLIQGTSNQYNNVEGNLGVSACGVISLMALKAMLKGTIGSAEQINKIVQDGTSEYPQAIEKIEKETNRAVAYGDQIDVYALEYVLPNDLTVDLMSLINFELHEQSAKDYQIALEQLASTIAPGEKTGAIMTVPPETYSLVIEKGQQGQISVSFFDSHGHHDTTGTSNAYLQVFYSLKDASVFLGERKAFIPDADIYNHGAILPFSLVANQAPVARNINAAIPPVQNKPFVAVVNNPLPAVNNLPAFKTVFATALEKNAEMIRLLSQIQEESQKNNRNQVGLLVGALATLNGFGPQTADLEDRVYFHVYNLQKQNKAPTFKDHTPNYGEKALYGTHGFTISNQEVTEVARRVILETILNNLLTAAEKEDVVTLNAFHDLLWKYNSKYAGELIQGGIYNKCKDAVNKGAKININSTDFGRHGFREEWGFKAPKDIKIAVLKEVIAKFQQEIKP